MNQINTSLKLDFFPKKEQRQKPLLSEIILVHIVKMPDTGNLCVLTALVANCT
jgi:hypothetical protein